MDNFYFLNHLDDSLYRRYLMIEESIKMHNGNVFLNMQIYLEHLFKYISKRQGYNIHNNKKLGELLNDYRIQNFCFIQLEYDKLNELKQINHLGNNYKHNEIVDFNFSKFMYFMDSIYTLSIKVYNYYQQNKINQIFPLNRQYYKDLMLLKDKKENTIMSLESELCLVREDLELKERTIVQLTNELEEEKQFSKSLRKENKKIQKQLTAQSKQINQLENQVYRLKRSLDVLYPLFHHEVYKHRVAYKFSESLIEKIKSSN